MVLSITIGGSDISGTVRPSTLHITDDLEGRNTCEFVVASETAITEHSIGKEVVVLDGATTLYKGTLLTVDRGQIGGDVGYEYSYTCADYTTRLTRRLVAFAYEDMYADDIIIHLITYFATSEAISAVKVGSGGYVKQGQLLNKAVFNWCTVAEALDELAEACGYAWYVDYNKALHFFDRTTNAAPFDLDATHRYYKELVIKKDRDQYRNVQYIEGGAATSDYRTESYTGDPAAEEDEYKTAYPIVTVPSVWVNGVQKTVGIGQIDEGKDWYWNKDSDSLKQDKDGTRLTASDTLTIKYQWSFPLIEVVVDSAKITERQGVEGASGRYEALESDRTMDSYEWSYEKGLRLIAKYGIENQEIEFTTHTTGLKAGQLLHIDLAEYGIHADYLITSVELEDVDFVQYYYTVNCASGEPFGSWALFFSDLAQKGRKTSIGENTDVNILYRFPESKDISDVLTRTTAAPVITCNTTSYAGFSEVA